MGDVVIELLMFVQFRSVQWSMIGGLSNRQTTMAICANNNKNDKHAPLLLSAAGCAAVGDPGHCCDDLNPT